MTFTVSLATHTTLPLPLPFPLSPPFLFYFIQSQSQQYWFRFVLLEIHLHFSRQVVSTPLPSPISSSINLAGLTTCCVLVRTYKEQDPGRISLVFALLPSTLFSDLARKRTTHLSPSQPHRHNQTSPLCLVHFI